MCEVTVAIASYNVEKYIEQCLLSVLNQDFEDMEILVCDDCSTDDTISIIERLAKSHPKGNLIRILRGAQNQGTASIRNIGIDNAKGGYLLFLDGDDILPDNAISCLYSKICMTDGDIVSANMRVFCDNPDNQLNTNGDQWHDTCDTSGFFAIPKWMEKERTILYYAGMPCKLYKMDFLHKNNIRCRAEHRVVEDTYFTFQTLLYATSFSRISDVALLYRQHFLSATKINIDRKRMNLYLLIFDDICCCLDQYKVKHLELDIHPMVYNYIFRNFVSGFFNNKVMSSSLLSKKDKIDYLNHVAQLSKHGIKKEFILGRLNKILFKMLMSKNRFILIYYFFPFLAKMFRLIRLLVKRAKS